MKRTTFLTAFVMILSVILVAGGCGLRAFTPPEASESQEAVHETQAPDTAASTGGEKPEDTAAAEISEEAPSAQPEAGELKYETVTYENGKIVIKYPQFTNLPDSEAQNKINGLISDRALKDLKELEGQAVEYELDYKVTLANPGVISVYFNGYMNFEQSAHPGNVFFTMNIDVKDRTTISLSELVYINDGFIALFQKGKLSSMLFDMEPGIEESLKEYLFDSGMMDWTAELRNADTEGSYTFSYLTEDSLVISVNVPHVYGDHVEISLAYGQLKGYQTDNELWLAITQDT